MARETDDDVHTGVKRLTLLARELEQASTGASTEKQFPLFGETIRVKAEVLAADEVFIAIGNNRIGALSANRVSADGRMEEMVANAIGDAIHTYLRRMMRQFRAAPDQVNVEETDADATVEATSE